MRTYLHVFIKNTFKMLAQRQKSNRIIGMNIKSLKIPNIEISANAIAC